MSTLQCYRQLIAWQKAMDLATACYQVTQSFPREEQFGLTSQMRRAAAGIPASIAEGHARDSRKEFLYFLSIARGSLSELETHIILSERLGYLPQEAVAGLLQRTAEVGRLISGLQRSLRAKEPESRTNR